MKGAVSKKFEFLLFRVLVDLTVFRGVFRERNTSNTQKRAYALSREEGAETDRTATKRREREEERIVIYTRVSFLKKCVRVVYDR